MVLRKVCDTCLRDSVGIRSCTMSIASRWFIPSLPRSRRRRTSTANCAVSSLTIAGLPALLPNRCRWDALACAYECKVEDGIRTRFENSYIDMSGLADNRSPVLLSQSSFAWLSRFRASPFDQLSRLRLIGAGTVGGLLRAP